MKPPVSVLRSSACLCIIALLGCPTEYHLRPETETSATTQAETEANATGQGNEATETQGAEGDLSESQAAAEEEAEADDAEADDDAEDSAQACPNGDEWERCDGSECIDLSADDDHCGECWNRCRRGGCFEGECVHECNPELEEDERACDIHLEFCPEDEDIEETFCRCRPGLTNCAGICRNLFNDPENCGECGHVCESGESCLRTDDEYGDPIAECEAIECEDDEDDDLAYCDGVCVDIEFDPLNCGECGHRCEAYDLCFGGECFHVEYVPEGECDACPCDACEESEELPICCEVEFEEFPVVCAEENEEIEEFCDE